VPAFEYTGGDVRHYPSLGLDAEPGLVVEFDARPPAPAEGVPSLQQPEGARWVPDDGRWTPTKKKPTPPPAAEQAPADAPADDGQKEA
jgi:hypothetical protein